MTARKRFELYHDSAVLAGSFRWFIYFHHIAEEADSTTFRFLILEAMSPVLKLTGCRMVGTNVVSIFDDAVQ